MTQTIMEIDGIPVYIEGDGIETVLMIHGWPDTYHLWDGQIEAMSQQYRCVRFTLPGFEIGAARRKWSIEELCLFFDRVIDATSQGKPVTLLLHDWGCTFGYRLYLKNPDKIKRIIGVDVGDPVSRWEEASLKVRISILVYQHWLAFAWLIGGRTGNWMAQTMARIGHCPTIGPQVTANQAYPYYMNWLAGAQSYRQNKRRFVPSCPMLFIYGLKKPFMFHTEGWLTRVLENPLSKALAFDSGHWVMIEQSEQFTSAVINWLDIADHKIA